MRRNSSHDQVQSASRNKQRSGKTVMGVRFAALLPNAPFTGFAPQVDLKIGLKRAQ
jgi:hypothetical protein